MSTEYKEPQCQVNISVCRGATCHVAGSAEVISSIEKQLGIGIGDSTPDGKYLLEYTECIGQCQSSPTVIINGKLFTDMTADKITDILKKRDAIAQAKEKGIYADVTVRVHSGADFSAIGSPQYPAKVFSLSGDIANKGGFEAPTNVTLRDIIFGFGGGVANGHKLKAVQVGGSSCGFLTPDKLDTPVDFDSMRAIGSALGSGAILVIDDSHNIVDMLVGIADFFNHESCGKCAPCREGTLRAAQLIKKIADGEGSKKDMEQIKDLSEMMGMSCFCPLGQTATTAVISALELFHEDFSSKISKREV